jgi:hypothetical protein
LNRQDAKTAKKKKKVAHDGFQGGVICSPFGAKIKDHRGIHQEPRKFERDKTTRSHSFFSLFTLSPLGEPGVLAVQFFDGIDRFEPPPWNPSRAFS